MKRFLTTTLSLLVILVTVGIDTTVRAETIETRIGKLSFTHDFANGYPAKETVEKLYDERDFQRACQAYLWALPIVASAQMQEQARTVFGAGDLDLGLSKGYAEVSGILTPNVVTPYMGGSPDLGKTGPLVIEVPAGPMAGLVDDFWQRPVTDLGLAGPDQGRGGKFLLLGPGQTVPQTAGFIVVHSSTLNVIIFIRNLETDPTKAEQLQKQFRYYPYAQRDNPPTNHILRAKGKIYSQMQPRGLAYWERLADILSREPVQQFWSLTIYEVDTRSLIQNRQQIADRSSRQPDLVRNADGSVDLYVGPTAPAGFEKNWIPSVPGRAWFAYFRLYAPTEAHFNRTWTLPDFEKMK